MAIKLDDLSKYKSPGVYTVEYDVSDFRPHITENIVSHINSLYRMLGSDMTFSKWNSMTDSEQKKFERDLKIRKLLDI